MLTSWPFVSLTGRWIKVEKTHFSFVSLGLQTWPLDNHTDQQGQVLSASTKTLNTFLQLDTKWAESLGDRAGPVQLIHFPKARPRPESQTRTVPAQRGWNGLWKPSPRQAARGTVRGPRLRCQQRPPHQGHTSVHGANRRHGARGPWHQAARGGAGSLGEGKNWPCCKR